MANFLHVTVFVATADGRAFTHCCWDDTTMFNIGGYGGVGTSSMLDKLLLILSIFQFEDRPRCYCLKSAHLLVPKLFKSVDFWLNYLNNTRWAYLRHDLISSHLTSPHMSSYFNFRTMWGQPKQWFYFVLQHNCWVSSSIINSTQSRTIGLQLQFAEVNVWQN